MIIGRIFGRNRPLIHSDSEVYRSPKGYPVTREGDVMRCVGTGVLYLVRNGTPLLHEPEDVPHSLHAESQIPENIADAMIEQDMSDPGEQHYAAAKALNCDFMFSTLRYRRPETRRVVELGAWRCEKISRFADASWQAYAVDFYTGMMDRAAKRHTGKPFHRVSAPMSVLPFQDGTIDLLYMHATLHHALPRDPAEFRWCDPRNMDDALREIRRVLKPDGAFFLLGEGVYPEGTLIEDRYHERRAQRGETPYESWYTMSEYEGAFERAGIWPTLMSNQTDLIFELHTYNDGRRIDLISVGDEVASERYAQIGLIIDGKHPDWRRQFLPRWIS